ncbi:hypothetical protein Tco_1543428, partial [Tanacetum coccineum]
MDHRRSNLHEDSEWEENQEWLDSFDKNDLRFLKAESMISRSSIELSRVVNPQRGWN